MWRYLLVVHADHPDHVAETLPFRLCTQPVVAGSEVTAVVESIHSALHYLREWKAQRWIGTRLIEFRVLHAVPSTAVRLRRCASCGVVTDAALCDQCAFHFDS